MDIRTRASVVLVSLLALAGCTTPAPDKTVVITYQPLINTNAFFPGGEQPNKKNMIYCIARITNTGADAINFQFDLNDLRLQDPADTFVNNAYKTAQNIVVAAGTTEYNLGRIVIRADVTGLPNNGDDATVNLLYDVTGPESVIMVKYPIPPDPQFTPVITSQAQIPVCLDGTVIPP